MFRRRDRALDRLADAGLALAGLAFCATAYLAIRPLGAPSPPSGRAGPVAVREDRSTARLTEADLKVLWEGLDPDRPAVKREPASAAAAGKAQPTENLPTLRGVVYSTAGASVAFMEVGGKVLFFREGDAVDKWTVQEISRGAVSLVAEDGERRRLTLQRRPYADRPSRSVAGNRPRPEAAVARPNPPGAEMIRPAKRGPGSGSTQPSVLARAGSPVVRRPRPVRVAGVERTVAVARVHVDLARRDPAAAMQGVRLEPVVDGGKMQGIAVRNVVTGSLAARYGLAPGDRIVAVNGQPLDSPARVFELYRRYRNSDSVRVTLERGGRRREVVFYAR